MSVPVARFAACKHAGVVRRVLVTHRSLSTTADTPPAPAAPAVRFSTTEFIPNHQITAYYGIAEGSTVRTKNAGHDFLAGLKQIIGGELSSYTELLREARAEAMDRLAKDAAGKGANAVVGLRLVSSSVSAGASEILAYGTAVTVKEE